MKIIYQANDPAFFKQQWQVYLGRNPGTFRYLPSYLEYMRWYCDKLESEESFVGIQDGEPVGVCFLPVERGGKGLTVTLGGSYTVAPLARNRRVLDAIYGEIEAVAARKGIGKIQFFLDPLLDWKAGFNQLRRYGFVDTSTSDCLLDLRKDMKSLWGGVRKGHKHDINRMARKPELKVLRFDWTNASYEAHECYRELHAKCSGRVTRRRETFEAMFQMLKDGNASLFGLAHGGQFICFNYFLHYGKTVVYYSGADDPEFSYLPLYHLLIWEAIKYYHDRGCELLEFSPPCMYHVINGFGDYGDSKQVSISRFKRGFGGEMAAFFRGIKYFDRALLLAEIDEFQRRAAECWVGGEAEIVQNSSGLMPNCGNVAGSSGVVSTNREVGY